MGQTDLTANRYFHFCVGMARMSVHINIALLCRDNTIKLLIIVWDLLLIEGSVVLLKVALILLEYLKPVIDEAKDFGNLFMLRSPFLQTL